jgi:hypothetical protein
MISLETRLLFFLSNFSVGNSGGGKGTPGGVTDRRDFLEVRDGVRYGVPAGVGKAATAALLSSSSSVWPAIVQCFVICSRPVPKLFGPDDVGSCVE